MARDSYRASTDSIAAARGRDNAIRTIASAAVAAPATKIATKLLSIGTPAVVRASRTATRAAAAELPTVRAIAFMLVATPVSPASTSATTNAGSAPYPRLM